MVYLLSKCVRVNTCLYRYISIDSHKDTMTVEDTVNPEVTNISQRSVKISDMMMKSSLVSSLISGFVHSSLKSPTSLIMTW